MTSINSEGDEINKFDLKEKENYEIEKKFLTLLHLFATINESAVAQNLSYERWAGIPYGTKIDEEAVVKEILESAMFSTISKMFNQMSKKLESVPHPEDGKEAFIKWYEDSCRKYDLRIKYHKLFELIKKE